MSHLYSTISSDTPRNHAVIGALEKANTFKEALGSRLFLAVTLLTALAYLSFFKYLDIATRVPVMATPNYFVLFYSLVLVSSVLMGLNVYSLRSNLARRRVKSNASFGSSSAAMSLFGGVVSCSCHTSLLLPLLSFLGWNALSGMGIITALVEYQFLILVLFIVGDLYLIYRVMARIRTRQF